MDGYREREIERATTEYRVKSVLYSIRRRPPPVPASANAIAFQHQRQRERERERDPVVELAFNCGVDDGVVVSTVSL
jgi:hypothetical protein